jgi:hypothetical protein
MLQFGNKILEYLESILDKIIKSSNAVNDIKSVEVIKTESMNLSKDIYTEKGDLYILILYVNDLYSSAQSNGELNEILIKSDEIINRIGLEKEIYGAWNRYKENNGNLNKEFHQWQDFNFDFIANKNNEVIQYFTIKLKRYESLYDHLNGKNQTDDFDDVFANNSNNFIIYQFAKIKYDEILLEVFALLDLTLLRINEFLKSNNKPLKEKSNILELYELDKFESTKNHIYKNPVAINAFEKIINDNTFLFTLSDFSQLFRFIEENYFERLQHKPYLEYIQSRFKEKIDSSFNSMKIEKAKDSKQTKFANIVNN